MVFDDDVYAFEPPLFLDRYWTAEALIAVGHVLEKATYLGILVLFGKLLCTLS